MGIGGTINDVPFLNELGLPMASPFATKAALKASIIHMDAFSNELLNETRRRYGIKS